MTALRSLLILSLGLLLGWVTVTAVRKGAYTARGGVRISRRHTPISFWLGVLAAGTGCLLALYQGLRIAGGG